MLVWLTPHSVYSYLQNQSAASRCEHHVSSPSSEGDGRDVIRRAICVGRFDRKRGANIRARVKHRPSSLPSKVSSPNGLSPTIPCAVYAQLIKTLRLAQK